jgi:hypothetical protein
MPPARPGSGPRRAAHARSRHPGQLDPADDTDNGAADFVTGVPTPRNDANMTGPSLGFYTVAPCHVVDTRNSGGALSADVERIFTLAGTCGIPTSAQAVSLNVAVSGSSAPGNVRLYPAGEDAPLVSAVNYALG